MHHDTRLAEFARGGSATPAAFSIRPAHVLAALVAMLGLQNLVLLSFLDVGTAPVYLAAALLVALVVRSLLTHPRTSDCRLTPARVGCCFLISLAVLLMAGEGRLFYSNYDWQVRDAVLRDMIVNPWPFAYADRGTAEILRAPIGMYLFPALAGKLGGMKAADAALLLQNALFLAAVLCLSSVLFKTTRTRLIGAAVFLGFSGMDFVGQMLVDPAHAAKPTSHLEWWLSMQYSSTLTLAFWVPNHALPGWLSASLFMLWRERRLPLAAFLAPLPLLALWSPLSLIGALPFAAYAGFHDLSRRELRASDMMLPAVTAVLAVPALLYLQSASGSVGIGFHPVPAAVYALHLLLEVLPFLVCVWLLARGGRFGGATFAIVAAALLIFPFIHIGENSDFLMRATIPALAVLAVLVGDEVAAERSSTGAMLPKGLLVGTLALGLVTPAHELARTFSFHASPYPRCSFVAAWDQSFPAIGKSTYLADLRLIPPPIAPSRPALVSQHHPASCWSRPWMVPRS